MKQDGIGAPLRRREDHRFLVGRGRYVGDLAESGELHAVFVRSHHAHAAIRAIDTSAALAMPGVHLVATHADLAADGIKPVPSRTAINDRHGRATPDVPRHALAEARARVVGDPLAIVVADTLDTARDAAEAVQIDDEALPAVTSMSDALVEGAPQIWDHVPGNLAYDWSSGDADAVAVAFADAAHTVTLDLVNNRITANPMEPRLMVAEPDPQTGGLIITTGNQAPHLFRTRLAPLIGMAESDLRIVSPDFGGGFGMRASPYAEDVAIAWAARRLGRAVRWTGERHEVIASDTHARDHETHAELALDGEGRFLAMRVRTRANLGAYVTGFSAGVAVLLYAPLLAGIYKFDAIDIGIEGVITNTQTTSPYRGAGRPEATYVVERLVDEAARTTGIDPVELRRRNMQDPQDLPATTATGLVIDSGNFDATLDAALDAADETGFAERRAASEADGQLRGFGFATYVESAADGSGSSYEMARLRFHPTGTATLHVGTHSHGQGHPTAFPQIAAEILGIPSANIELSYGDTASEPYGLGTYGSRSLVSAGPAIALAARKVVAKGRRIAAHMMEAAEGDIEFAEGVFSIAGTDRRVTLEEVALAAYVPHDFPHDELEPGLDETAFAQVKATTYPNGWHIAEVEIDPDTGHVRLDRYLAVDDIGTVINPMIVEGQIHGAVAQGVGQALMEECRYDPKSGQFLSATFLDYCMPRADDLPFLSWSTLPVPTRTNSLGVKGVGEVGTIAAPPAIMNALMDALAPLGVTHIDMPATPEAVWRAIRDARA